MRRRRVFKGSGYIPQTLLDVPRDRPTREQEIKAFKTAEGIETYRSDGIPEAPWVALHLPTARAIGKDYGLPETTTMIDYIAELCRILEEAGALVDGKGELDVLRKVCSNLNIPCNL